MTQLPLQKEQMTTAMAVPSTCIVWHKISCMPQPAWLQCNMPRLRPEHNAACGAAETYLSSRVYLLLASQEQQNITLRLCEVNLHDRDQCCIHVVTLRRLYNSSSLRRLAYRLEGLPVTLEHAQRMVE